MNNCCKCQLIDVDCFKVYTGFPDYVRVESLHPHLRVVNELYITELIGIDCFNELCDAKQSETITDKQQDLLNILAPYAAIYTAFCYLDFTVYATGLGAKLINNKATGDPDRNQITAQKARLRHDISQYRERVLCFLQENLEFFPCYPVKCKPPGFNGFAPIFTWSGNATKAKSMNYPEYYEQFYNSREYYIYLYENYRDAFFY